MGEEVGLAASVYCLGDTRLYDEGLVRSVYLVGDAMENKLVCGIMVEFGSFGYTAE